MPSTVRSKSATAHRRNKWRHLLALFMVVGLIMPPFSIYHTGASTMLAPTKSAKAQFIVDEPTTPTTGLQIDLSEGAEQPDVVEQPPLAPAEPLDDEAIQALLDRVPPLAVGETDQVEFRLPEEVLPPPRPGATVDETFPPTEEGAAPAETTSGQQEFIC